MGLDLGWGEEEQRKTIISNELSLNVVVSCVRMFTNTHLSPIYNKTPVKSPMIKQMWTNAAHTHA